jgi:sulfur carrier protein ThiS
LKADGEVVVVNRNIVPKEAKPWSITIGDPYVEIAIVVPVGGYQSSAIVRKVYS